MNDRGNMGAHLKQLMPAQEVMLHTLNWLEQTFEGHCGVLDLEWETGALTLYGHDCGDYRKQFNKIVKGVWNG